MNYRVPLQDIRYVMTELAGLDDVLSLPGYEDCTKDVVDAVLDENARFVEEVIAPLNREGDKQPARWAAGDVHTPPGWREAFREFAEGGWQGLMHDPEWGGQGLPKLLGAAAGESLNAANLAFALCPLLTDGVIEALTTVGSATQRALYVPPLLEGRWTGTMNLTEPQAGSDLAAVSTRATPQADGSYRLHGQKIFITYGEHDLAENIIHLVLARTPNAPEGVKGISLFIVPKFLVNEDGSLGARNDVYCASLEHKLGIHGSPTAVLLYGDGKGDVGPGAVGYLVGEENRGLEYMFIMMNAARYAVGLQGIAICERAYQQAQHYAQQRIQGRAVGRDGDAGPIAQHPDVQRMLLTMRALTEGARALAYIAAAANDCARAHPDPQRRERDRAFYDYLVPIVKGYSTEIAVEVSSLGIQVHGGMGYIEETGAAQYLRDARILPIYEGTTAIQANDLIGRKLLRDGGAVAREVARAMRQTLAEMQAEAADGQESTDLQTPAALLAMIASRFEIAIDSYERATEYCLSQAQTQTRAVFVGSVPYLMLAGTVHAGWQLARSALRSARYVDNGKATAFHREKLATAVFYAAHILPRAAALSAAVQAGHWADAASEVFLQE